MIRYYVESSRISSGKRPESIYPKTYFRTTSMMEQIDRLPVSQGSLMLSLHYRLIKVIRLPFSFGSGRLEVKTTVAIIDAQGESFVNYPDVLLESRQHP
jgi:hypothetical protein